MRELEARIEIKASKQAVWEVMADFGSAAAWAPGMRQSSLKSEKKTGVGCHRFMRHKWGFNIEEIVTQWIQGSGYSFKLTQAPYPMRDVCETWVLKQNDVQVLLTVTVSYGMRLGLIGALLDRVLVRFIVARELRLGICGLRDYVEKLFARNLKVVGH
jgi:hypothetical protein